MIKKTSNHHLQCTLGPRRVCKRRGGTLGTRLSFGAEAKTCYTGSPASERRPGNSASRLQGTALLFFQTRDGCIGELGLRIDGHVKLVTY
jgi:hypothetical protein